MTRRMPWIVVLTLVASGFLPLDVSARPGVAAAAFQAGEETGTGSSEGGAEGAAAGPAESVGIAPDSAADVVAAPAAAPSGLPRRAPTPRTMKAQWPVFAGLAVSWIGIVGYVLVLGRRSRRLADLVERTGGDGRSA